MLCSYFGCKIGDQDTNWALPICCVTCVRILTGLLNGSRQMQFAFPMVWRKLEEYSSANTTGITSKFKHTVKCPDLPSAMKPVPHSAELFVPKLLLIFRD